MAQLNNCSSLLEVGLGLNLVAPIVSSAIGGIQEKTISRYRIEYSRRRPGKSLDASSAPKFDKFVLDSHRNLNILIQYLSILPPLSVLTAAISAYLLALSAINPSFYISDQIVWSYWWIAIVILPISYFSVRIIANLIERRLAEKVTPNDDGVEQLIECFEITLPGMEFIDDADELLKSSRKLFRDMRASERRRQRLAIFERIADFFRVIKYRISSRQRVLRFRKK